jgi:hypothetical protein
LTTRCRREDRQTARCFLREESVDREVFAFSIIGRGAPLIVDIA